MDSGSTRVEIELEPQEPKRSRRRAAQQPVPSVVLDAPPVVALAESEPSQGAPRNQLVITALAVGLVALFLGWVLGRAGGDDTEAQTGGSAPATTAPSTTVAPSTSAVTDETLPAAELPSTTRPPRTTTTTLPPAWSEGRVALDPRLAGLTDQLIVVTDNRVVSDIDLARGSMRRIELPRPNGTTNAVVAGDGWLMLTNDSGSAPTVVRDDGTIERPQEFVDSWGTFRDVGSDGFWVVTYDPRNGRIESARLRTVDGDDTGVEISTRGRWIAGSDPAGGLLVADNAGALFRVAPDGRSSRVADGALVAISAERVLVHRCGADLDSCQVVLVDRSSGEERVVPTSDDATLAVATFGGWFGGPMTAPTLNADGSAALIVIPSDQGQPTMSVLDTVTGEVRALTSPLSDATMFVPYLGAACSSDGRVAFVSLANDIYAYDRTSDDLFPIAPDAAFDAAGVLTVVPT